MIQAQKKSTSLSNYAIDNYIKRVSELSQSEQKIPTNEELEKIAAELGISDEEIEVAKKKSHDHFVRAQGYFKLKFWDDAISELQEAVVFNPSNLDMLNLLANSHLGRWYERHSQSDRLQIRIRIKQCLEIKPDHQESLHLLAKLSRCVKQRNKKKALLAILLSAFMGSVFGYFFLNGISLKIFSKQDVELQKLRSELILEIDELERERDILLNNFNEKESKKHQINQRNISQSQQRIQILEKENKKLNQQINQLQNKVQQIENYLINGN